LCLQELDALAAAGFVDRNTRSLLISAAITPYLFPILPLLVWFRLLRIVTDLIMFSSLPMLSSRIIFHELGSTLSLSLLIEELSFCARSGEHFLVYLSIIATRQ
jgi:hypothetical protein